jgi:hypothetical protein
VPSLVRWTSGRRESFTGPKSHQALVISCRAWSPEPGMNLKQLPRSRLLPLIHPLPSVLPPPSP